MDEGFYAFDLNTIQDYLRHGRFNYIAWEHKGRYEDVKRFTFYPKKLINGDLLNALYGKLE